MTDRFGPRNHLFVVPDGAPDALIDHPSASAPTLAGAKVVVGYAGHLYPWKGVDTLVRAIARTSSVEALIVGGHAQEPDFARVANLARELGVESRVTMTGMVAPSEVPRRLAAATILALPNTLSAISSRYTSPLKLFEYLALGRPIVASDLASIREILTPDETAVLVTPEDPDAWATAFSNLAASPERAAALAAAARQLAPQYSWSARAARLEAAFTAVCS